MALDQSRLEELLGRFVQDFGATGFAATVVIGDKLGLYQALAAGPATSAELAHRTSTHPRLVTVAFRPGRQRLCRLRPRRRRCRSPEEQAFASEAHEDGPMYLPGAFQVMVAAVKDEPQGHRSLSQRRRGRLARARSGLFAGTERFFRPGYAANLVSSWIPSSGRCPGQAEAGALVADVAAAMVPPPS